MSKVVFAGLALLCGALPGCASIVEGTTQNIAVTTSPVDGAKCVLTSSEGTYYVTTPGNAMVHKTKNDLAVQCDHDGYAHAAQTLPSHFNGATAGNLFAGGIIGIGIDAATGANYNYPDSVNVRMEPALGMAPAMAVVPAAVAAGKPTT